MKHESNRGLAQRKRTIRCQGTLKRSTGDGS